jgi:hypothetical protein
VTLRADSYVAALDRLNYSLYLMSFGQFTLIKVKMHFTRRTIFDSAVSRYKLHRGKKTTSSATPQKKLYFFETHSETCAIIVFRNRQYSRSWIYNKFTNEGRFRTSDHYSSLCSSRSCNWKHLQYTGLFGKLSWVAWDLMDTVKGQLPIVHDKARVSRYCPQQKKVDTCSVLYRELKTFH